jgi:uncharacterized membrane protein YfcA
MNASSLMALIPLMFFGGQIQLDKAIIGNLDLSIATVFIVGSLLTTYFGAKWNSSISAFRKRRILITLLFVLTLKMIFDLIEF